MEMSDVDKLQAELLRAVENAADLEALEAARVTALGRKGRLTQGMKNLGSLDPDARKAASRTPRRSSIA